MKRYLVLLVFALAAGGCSATGSVPPATGASVAATVAAKSPPNAYWTLFANQKPAIEISAIPLSQKNAATHIDGTARNMLSHTCCIRIHKNLAWVLTSADQQSQNVLLIFRLPITQQSLPLYYDTLEGNTFGVHIEFDAHDNLWMSALGPQRNLSTVTEYTGDFFQEGGDFQPALTLTAGLHTPQGIGFDQNGYLYVANAGADNVAVFAQPIENKKPYALTGIANPGGIAFDAKGNLFAASNNGSTGAMVEYKKNDLRGGNKPNIVDPKGIHANPYGSDLTFDSAGNLYDADCGDHAGIYTYPLATKTFTSTLQPSFYTNQSILQNGCTWGIAIH